MAKRARTARAGIARRHLPTVVVVAGRDGVADDLRQRGQAQACVRSRARHAGDRRRELHERVARAAREKGEGGRHQAQVSLRTREFCGVARKLASQAWRLQSDAVNLWLSCKLAPRVMPEFPRVERSIWLLVTFGLN